MANIVRRAIGPSDAGIPEDTVVDVVIPLVHPPGLVLRDLKTGDTYDHTGRKLPKRDQRRGHMKTPHELACAISALINSSPRSPTIAELEAVIAEHWQPVRWKPLVAYDPEAVADAIQEMAEAKGEVLVWNKSNALAELVECVDELRCAEEPTSRDIALRVLEIFQEAKVVPKPPMVAVTDRIRDSICLGGVA